MVPPFPPEGGKGEGGIGWGLPAPGAPSSPLLPRWRNCRSICRKPVPSDSCIQDNCRSICRKLVSSDSCFQESVSRRRKHVSSCGLLRPQGAPNTERGVRQPAWLPEKGVRRVRRRRGRGQHGHHLPVRGPLRRQEALLGQGRMGWGAGRNPCSPAADCYCRDEDGWAARRGCTSATPSGTVAPSFQGVPRLYSTRAPP